MNDILSISSFVVSFFGFALAASMAGMLIFSKYETSRLAGWQFLSTGFIYAALAVPSLNIWHKFTPDDWMLYRIFLDVTVLFSMLSTWKFYKKLRGD